MRKISTNFEDSLYNAFDRLIYLFCHIFGEEMGEIILIKALHGGIIFLLLVCEVFFAGLSMYAVGKTHPIVPVFLLVLTGYVLFCIFKELYEFLTDVEMHILMQHFKNDDN